MAAELPPTRWPGPPTAYLPIAEHGIIGDDQIGSSGELLGDFPQAFTHLALISAIGLDRELQTERSSQAKPDAT